MPGPTAVDRAAPRRPHHHPRLRRDVREHQRQVRLRVEEQPRGEIVGALDIDYVRFAVRRLRLSGIRIRDREGGLRTGDDPQQQAREIPRDRLSALRRPAASSGRLAITRMPGWLDDVGEGPLAFEAFGPRHRHHSCPDIDLDVLVRHSTSISMSPDIWAPPRPPVRPTRSDHRDEHRSASAAARGH